MADHQHSYAEWKKESGKQRADELQKFEADRQKDEQFILEMEKDVKEKRQVNASNQENPEEVADELQIVEESIEAERAVLTE